MEPRPTRWWRPAPGFAVAFNVAASALLALLCFLPVLWGGATALAAIGQLPAVLGALAAVAVASYFRGRMQAQAATPPRND